MPPMTDRGLPIVDGAPACPFVAFDDDRDARALSPDHRHRCYAEVRPAPRALAHQEAYCLSSAFPACPTFQDWARREAARAELSEPAEPATDVRPDEGNSAIDRTTGRSGSGSHPQRNPPRDWAAPPPWLGGIRDPAGEPDPEVAAVPPPSGGGLSGSLADRMLGGALASSPAPERDDPAADGVDDEDDDGPMSTVQPPRRASAKRTRERPRRPDQLGPSWERPRRREAYPTLKTRMGLQGVSLPPVLLGVAAVAVAAVALFYLPALVGVGNPPGPSPSPTPTLQPSADTGASATPFEATPLPGPTPQVYVVQSGDTMSRIANRFGVPLQALIEANMETIPNPDVLEIGQEVLIPSTTPTALPDAGGSPSPSP